MHDLFFYVFNHYLLLLSHIQNFFLFLLLLYAIYNHLLILHNIFIFSYYCFRLFLYLKFLSLYFWFNLSFFLQKFNTNFHRCRIWQTWRNKFELISINSHSLNLSLLRNRHWKHLLVYLLRCWSLRQIPFCEWWQITVDFYLLSFSRFPIILVMVSDLS